MVSLPKCQNGTSWEMDQDEVGHLLSGMLVHRMSYVIEKPGWPCPMIFKILTSEN